MADWQRLTRKGLISLSRSIKHMQHRRKHLGSETRNILATPLAAYVVGQTLIVDGGLSL